uniref:Uncharacterized protein n=1 Tax=viral metagenome TaxID=1070528 RepID=A0A6C0K5Q6_9ZZZZ
MTRTRRGSYSKRQQEQQEQQEQQGQQEHLDLIPFRKKVNEWLRDVYIDTDSTTGYLVKKPGGFYGRKAKALVQQIYSMSPQVKLILGTRSIRTNSACLYLFYIVKFLSNYVIPPLAAFLAAYFYYFSDVPIQQQESVTETSTLNTTDTWTLDPVAAGTWTGNGIRTFLSVPLQFLGSTLDRTLHLSEVVDSVQITGSRLFYTPFVGLTTYILTHLALQCILNLQMLLSKQWALWNYQDLFLKETSEAIERSVTGYLKPNLIYTFEQYLIHSSKVGNLQDQILEHLLYTYRDDLDLLRETILEQLANAIRAIPLAEHLVQGKIGDQYLKGIHVLIRHADEDLSALLLQLNQEIHRFPGDMRQMAGRQFSCLRNLY